MPDKENYVLLRRVEYLKDKIISTVRDPMALEKYFYSDLKLVSNVRQFEKYDSMQHIEVQRVSYLNIG